MLLTQIFMYFSGRELFLSDASLFVDDAEAYEKYHRQEEPEASDEKVIFFFHIMLVDNLWGTEDMSLFEINEVLVYLCISPFHISRKHDVVLWNKLLAYQKS